MRAIKTATNRKVSAPGDSQYDYTMNTSLRMSPPSITESHIG